MVLVVLRVVHGCHALGPEEERIAHEPVFEDVAEDLRFMDSEVVQRYFDVLAERGQFLCYFDVSNCLWALQALEALYGFVFELIYHLWRLQALCRVHVLFFR